MRTATVTEAKNKLSALLDRVRGGESILILDRGVPVARIEPAVAHAEQLGRVQRLERAGVLRVGAAPPPLGLLRDPAPELRNGASGVRTLIEERRLGR